MQNWDLKERFLRVERVGGNLAQDEEYTVLDEEIFFLFPLKVLIGDLPLVTTFHLSLFASSEMIFTISRKNMSQKLSLLLLVFGLIWGLMLLHYTFQQPRHQSSVKLREQILDLSKRYVKALAEENKNTVDVENGASMAGYADLKRTIAVLLDDILQRLVKLENKIDYIVVNGSATNSPSGTTGNLVPVTTNKRINASGSIR
uniref:Coiled-coil domain containing 126 n=1 Tax=Equus caballus TaxID=9796 RepID=F7D8W1_HORSE